MPANAADFAGGTLPSGVVAFAPGQTSRTLAVAVAGDIGPEGGLNESFTLTLGNASAGVAITAPVATGVILNDDFASSAASQTLTGTSNPDVFLLGGGLGPAASNATTLEDFSRAQGERLDLSAIDAIAGTPGDDAFSFIGTAPFSGAAGELRWQDQGGVRLIQGTVNNDTVADVTIFVRGAGPVDAGWFVL